MNAKTMIVALVGAGMMLTTAAMASNSKPQNGKQSGGGKPKIVAASKPQNGKQSGGGNTGGGNTGGGNTGGGKPKFVVASNSKPQNGKQSGGGNTGGGKPKFA